MICCHALGAATFRNVRFGSLADILRCGSHVRFTPQKRTLIDGPVMFASKQTMADQSAVASLGATAGARLKIIRDLSAACSLARGRWKYPTKIQDIAGALIAEGYRSLDEQAKVLGVHRSTAWTIMKTKHKLGRLSRKTTNSMLANPALPPSVRIVVLQYLTERSDGLRSASSED